MNGKSKCKILKQIRQEIAKRNGIDYVTSECKFQGECTGTCPKCEAEVRQLEQELSKRRQAGKAVAVAGIAAALVASTVGCAMKEPPVTEPTSQQTETTMETQVDGEMVLPGDVPYEETEDTQELPEWMGVPVATEETLMGDVAVPEDQWQE